MSDEQVERIKGYAKKINKTIEDDDLLDYVADEILDRVKLYLNCDKLDEILERVIARIVSGIFNQTNSNLNSGSTEMTVSSMSDNGQTISFSGEVKNYLATTSDQEIFGGFTKLLDRYRRINVVS